MNSRQLKAALTALHANHDLTTTAIAISMRSGKVICTEKVLAEDYVAETLIVGIGERRRPMVIDIIAIEAIEVIP